MIKDLNYKTSVFTGTTQRESVGQGLARLVSTSLQATGTILKTKKNNEDKSLNDELYKLNKYVNDKKVLISNSDAKDNEKAEMYDELYRDIYENDSGIVPFGEDGESINLDLINKSEQGASKLSEFGLSLNGSKVKLDASYAQTQIEKMDNQIVLDSSNTYNSIINSPQYLSGDTNQRREMLSGLNKEYWQTMIASANSKDTKKTLLSLNNKYRKEIGSLQVEDNIALSTNILTQTINNGSLNATNFEETYRSHKNLNNNITRKSIIDQWSDADLIKIANDKTVMNIKDIKEKYSIFSFVKDDTKIEKLTKVAEESVSRNNVDFMVKNILKNPDSVDLESVKNDLDSNVYSEIKNTDSTMLMKKLQVSLDDDLTLGIQSEEPELVNESLTSIINLGIKSNTVDSISTKLINGELRGANQVSKAIDLVMTATSKGYNFSDKIEADAMSISLIIENMGITKDSSDEEKQAVYQIAIDSLGANKKRISPLQAMEEETIDEDFEDLTPVQNIALEKTREIYGIVAKRNNDSSLYKKIYEKQLAIEEGKSQEKIPYLATITKGLDKNIDLEDMLDNYNETNNLDDSELSFMYKTDNGQLVYNISYTDSLGIEKNKILTGKDLREEFVKTKKNITEEYEAKKDKKEFNTLSMKEWGDRNKAIIKKNDKNLITHRMSVEEIKSAQASIEDMYIPREQGLEDMTLSFFGFGIPTKMVGVKNTFSTAKSATKLIHRFGLSGKYKLIPTNISIMKNATKFDGQKQVLEIANRTKNAMTEVRQRGVATFNKKYPTSINVKNIDEYKKNLQIATETMKFDLLNKPDAVETLVNLYRKRGWINGRLSISEATAKYKDIVKHALKQFSRNGKPLNKKEMVELNFDFKKIYDADKLRLKTEKNIIDIRHDIKFGKKAIKE